MKYDDCQGHPMWFEKNRTFAWWAGIAAPGRCIYSPSTLITACIPQLCESETLRQHYAVGGKEPVFINPQDASARGIRNGDHRAGIQCAWAGTGRER
ncbi:trimethylamine-N-oxide reductase [Salmonella bongori]|nr:trimethylamine-N-oxide reductase [Salmonella bongori]